MKNLLNVIIIPILVAVFDCEKNSSPLGVIPSEFTISDDTHIPDSIRSLYKTDVARLSLRDVFLNKLYDTLSVIIPQHLIESFYVGLVHMSIDPAKCPAQLKPLIR